MPAKSLTFLASALAIAGAVLDPLAAQAAGVRQVGTWGRPAGMGTHVSNATCAGLAGFNTAGMTSVPGVGSGALHATMPGLTGNIATTVGAPNVITQAPLQQATSGSTATVGSGLGNTPLNVISYDNAGAGNNNQIDIAGNNNVVVNKPLNIYKPITIIKPITITKTIDASKNITINKNIDINNASFFRYGYSDRNGGGAANITVISEAGAEASATAGGDIAVNAEAGGTCHVADTTVVKAIHALCVSADGHQFPASHMTGETWINAGYEGEIARCLPGSTLKVMVASVMTSSEGMAVAMDDAQVLACGPGQAVRHFKGGMLKCATAVKVPDCTERTNLRKWGTGDMFFTYAARACLDRPSVTADQQRMMAEAADAKARALHLPDAR